MIIQEEKPSLLEKFRIGTTEQKAGITDESLPFIFDTLSKNLYKYKYRSIVRELTSNMKDAHVKANNTTDPCIIEYNKLQNSIHFIDSGSGMSPELMNNIYNDWGNSNKRDDNTQLGKFGLGSKSPLCLVSIFYINTHWEGIRYSYVYRKESNKRPTLTLISAETKEGKGTEVWFRTVPTDYNEWVNAAKTELVYFSKIIVKGLNYKNDYKLIKHEDFVIATNQYYPFSEICFGEVRYPIEYNAIGIKQLNLSLALNFENLGCGLEPTPSRESLIINPNLKTLILNKVEKVINYLREVYDKENKYHKGWFSYQDAKTSSQYVTLEEHKLYIPREYGFIPTYTGKKVLEFKKDFLTNFFSATIKLKKGSYYLDWKNFIGKDSMPTYYTEKGLTVKKNRNFQKPTLILTLLTEENIKDYFKKYVTQTDLFQAIDKPLNELEKEFVDTILYLQEEIKENCLCYDELADVELVRKKTTAKSTDTGSVYGFFTYKNNGAYRDTIELKKLREYDFLIHCNNANDVYKLNTFLQHSPFCKKEIKGQKYIGYHVSETQTKKLKNFTNIISLENFKKLPHIKKYVIKQLIGIENDNTTRYSPALIPFCPEIYHYNKLHPHRRVVTLSPFIANSMYSLFSLNKYDLIEENKNDRYCINFKIWEEEIAKKLRRRCNVSSEDVNHFKAQALLNYIIKQKRKHEKRD